MLPTRPDKVSFRVRAISRKACQKASSRLTLVLWPSIIIERLLIEDFMACPPGNPGNDCAWLEVIIVTGSRPKNSSVAFRCRKYAPKRGVGYRASFQRAGELAGHQRCSIRNIGRSPCWAAGDGSLTAVLGSSRAGLLRWLICVPPVDFSLAMRHQHVILGNADPLLQPPSGLDVRGRTAGTEDATSTQRRLQVGHALTYVRASASKSTEALLRPLWRPLTPWRMQSAFL